MAVPTLTTALTFFENIFDQGRTVLGPSAQALFNALVIMEVVFAGLYIALGSGADTKAIARKILSIGFLYWVVQNYSQVMKWILDGFLLVGQRASDATNLDIATLHDPYRIFIHGMNMLRPAADKLFALWSSAYFGIPNADMLILLFCIIVSTLAYGMMAIQVFITYLEFLLVAAAGFILVPFGVFKPTSFLVEKVFGAIIAFGIKLLILALIIGASDKFIATIALPETMSWQESFEVMVISLALAFLTLHAPSVAVGLLAGHPSLSFGLGASTAYGTQLAARQAAGATGQTVRGAASIPVGIGRGGAVVAGAAAGGAQASWSSLPPIQSSQGISGKTAAVAKKTAAGIAGAAMGLASAPTDAFLDRIVHGKGGGPEGRKQYQSKIGMDPKKGGISGHFDMGRYSVPQFRKYDAKRREDQKKKPSGANAP